MAGNILFVVTTGTRAVPPQTHRKVLEVLNSQYSKRWTYSCSPGKTAQTSSLELLLSDSWVERGVLVWHHLSKHQGCLVTQKEAFAGAAERADWFFEAPW